MSLNAKEKLYVEISKKITDKCKHKSADRRCLLKPESMGNVKNCNASECFNADVINKIVKECEKNNIMDVLTWTRELKEVGYHNHMIYNSKKVKIKLTECVPETLEELREMFPFIPFEENDRYEGWFTYSTSRGHKSRMFPLVYYKFHKDHWDEIKFILKKINDNKKG